MGQNGVKMFTGLIKEIAKVINFDGNILRLSSKLNPNIGDSIAINGVCLSVIKSSKDEFSLELSTETAKKIVTNNLKKFVHIEPAMSMNSKLDGHLVQGHVDCIGKIIKINKLQSGTDFFIQIPKKFIHLTPNKGSICVDGVSLTINEVDIKNSTIRLTIINLTMQTTLFSSYTINQNVNIETDMIARYLHWITVDSKETLTWEQVEKISAIF